MTAGGGDTRLSTLLRRHRLAAGLTQEELSELSGLSVRTISCLETGRSTKPYRRSLGLLADALSLPSAERALLMAVLRDQAGHGDSGQAGAPDATPATGAPDATPATGAPDATPATDAPEPAADVPASRSARQRASTTTPAAAPQPASPPRPAQLPSDIGGFAGRAEEMRRLRELLTSAGPASPVPVAAITGAGGLGKSALAVHVAHQLRRDFPDGQLFIELQGSPDQPLTSHEALARLLRHLGMPDSAIPKDEAECAAEYRTRLADMKMLILLDDARDAGQVRPLLPGTGSSAVLVTSRRWLADLDGSQPFPLGPLDRAESLELFRGICGAERVAAEPAATDTVLRACAGLPLAVRIAASRLVTRPGWQIASIAGRLAREMHRLEELRVGDLAVRTTFQVSYAALAGRQGSAAARAFRLLGLWPGPDISLPAAAALLGADARSAAMVLDKLVDVNMLQAPTPARYRFHDLLREYAAECAGQDEAAESCEHAVKRLLSWYLHTADAARAALMTSPRPRELAVAPVEPDVTPVEFTDLQVAADWADGERDHLAAAVQLAVRWQLHETCVQLAESVWTGHLRSPWQGWARVLEAAVSSAAAAGDVGSQAWMLNYLAVVAMYWGENDRALSLLERALPLSRSAGDLLGEATVTAHLGVACKGLRRFEAAIAHLDRALAIDASMNPLVRGRIQMNLGMLYVETGRLAEGAECMEKALAVAAETGDEQGDGLRRALLADAYRQLGRYSDAIRWANSALDIGRQARDSYQEAAALSTLGQALADTGQTARARSCLERALALATALGVPESAQIAASIAALGQGGGPARELSPSASPAHAPSASPARQLCQSLC